MQLEFPYQIVTFLDKEPTLNESVYYGDHGWYPQVAIKRRFKLNGIAEETFIKELKSFFAKVDTQTISTGEMIKPERMPVRVIHIRNQDELLGLHNDLLNRFENVITSRYPEREGENYYPHITVEYNDAFVIPARRYTNKSFKMNNIWLLKDIDSEDSSAYCKIR